MQLDAMLYLRIAQGVFAFIDLVLLSYGENSLVFMNAVRWIDFATDAIHSIKLVDRTLA